MLKDRNIIDAPEASLYGQPQVQFRPNDFDAAIWSHGYDVVCEQAVRCPCCGSSDAALPDCENCHGFGYFFINPVRTKALITGLNRSTNYVQWNPELMGTAAITVRDEDKRLVSFLNRVTVEDEIATFTESRLVTETVDGSVICFLSYAPVTIERVYKFYGSDQKLYRLDDSCYEIMEDNPYCLRFTKGNVEPETAISIVYTHRVEYHIIDMPHEIRASLGRDKMSGQFQILKMPVQSIGRRTHLLVGKPNYGGGGLLNNDDIER